ncbi:MAG: hypothetical protein A2Y91_03125 [Chloroflexi bacterium RBG_13_54_8]|nr:MAG: hypothetical protein A2Y91_03125 [Chloroflexi bacterium RBG_13_54_8]
MVEGAFQGVKMIESGHFLLVPGATVILADWGANLTKLENPKGGDPVRFPWPVEDWVPPSGVRMSPGVFIGEAWLLM